MKKNAYIAFALLGVIWGSNFIFMKWAAAYISPGQIVLLRVVFGFLPIFFFALAKRALRWEHLRYFHHFVVMSLLATAIYYFAFAKGTKLLPSGIAGMLSGSIPLFTFIFAWLFLKEERINMAKIAAVALSFAGVLLIARPWSNSVTIDIRGVVYMIIGSMSVGCSFVYARKFMTPLKLPAIALTTYQIGLAMIILFLTTSLGGIGAVARNTRAWTGLIFGLGLSGTGLAYVMYYYIIEKLGAVAAAGVTYIPPVVALLIGLFLANDKIDTLSYIAIVLIFSGVAFLQYGSRQVVSRKDK
jgi:drug/metabolite transporter (DMT)-like permease